MRSDAILSKDGLCPNIPNREVAPAMLRRCASIRIIAWRPPKKAEENYEFASEVAEAIHLRLLKLSLLYYPLSVFDVVEVMGYTARVT